ncbi:MAG TPA: TRAP transporter small permease subunit [Lautropia sp.]|nr:TRAP transporter small permease subunit [Lautropia sp.]
MQFLIRLIDRATTVIGVGAASLLVPLVLATCYEVFSRYVMDEPTAWAYEVGYLLTGSHFLLGLAYTLKKDLHIRIDVFTGLMSARTRALIDTLAYTVMLPLLLWLTWMLVEYLITGYSRGERSGQSSLNPPVWPFRLVFVVSFGLLALQVFAAMLKSVQQLVAPRVAR